MLNLGEIHWYLLRGAYYKEERQPKGGSLKSLFAKVINSGVDLTGDEIYWWVFTRETDLEELREQVVRTLEAAHVLKKASVSLRSKEPKTLVDLHTILCQFADSCAER